MAGFGFAPPLQRRLPLATGPDTSPQTSGNPPTLGAPGTPSGYLSGDIGQVRSTLQQLGITKTPTPGDNLPFVSTPGLPAAAPDMGSSAALDSAAGDAATNVAADATGAAAGDAAGAAASGGDIGELIAELFL